MCAGTVGRVGVLAVALGIGAAVASPACWADDESSATSSDASTADSVADAAPGPSTDVTSPGESANEPPPDGDSNSTATPSDPVEPVAESGSSPTEVVTETGPGVVVRSSGGAHTSKVRNRSARRQTDATEDDDPARPEVQQDADGPDPAPPVRPEVSERQPPNDPKVEVQQPISMTLAPAEEKVPVAAVASPQLIAASPASASGGVDEVLANLFSPPSGPVESPLAWAVLAWSRRQDAPEQSEQQQSFTAMSADVSLMAAPSYTYNPPDADGVVTGVLTATPATDEPPQFYGGGESSKGIVVVNSDGTFTFYPTPAALEAAKAPDAAATGADKITFNAYVDYRNGDVQPMEVTLPIGTPAPPDQPAATDAPAGDGVTAPEPTVGEPVDALDYFSSEGSIGEHPDAGADTQGAGPQRAAPRGERSKDHERRKLDTPQVMKAFETPASTPRKTERTEVAAPALPPLTPVALVVQLQVALFALVALMGGEGMQRGIGGLAVPLAAGGSGGAGGRVASVSAKSLNKVTVAGGVGDQSRSWRVPGTARFDGVMRALPVKLAPFSPMLARVVVDGSALRAMFGTGALALPAVGVLLALMVLRDTGSAASPPGVALLAAVAVLGVFDALAGFLSVMVVVTGVAVAGHLGTAAEVRTMMGLAVIWFFVPLIAGAARPLRRAAAQSVADWREWIGDLAIGTLIGAWAIQKMIKALPGLAGHPLPVTEHATLVAWIVLGACVVRIVLEAVAARWYPSRLADAQPADVPTPSKTQRIAAALIRTGLLLFVVSAFLGIGWQLWVGGLLFLIPLVLAVFEGRYPNSKFVHRWRPKGIVKVVVMLLVGAGVAFLVSRATEHTANPALNAFVLLAIPGVVIAFLEMFGREGYESRTGWGTWFSGAAVLGFGMWLVLFGL